MASRGAHELAVLSDVDGGVLLGALAEEVSGGHQMRAKGTAETGSKSEYACDEAEQQEVRTRLRELGCSKWRGGVNKPTAPSIAAASSMKTCCESSSF